MSSSINKMNMSIIFRIFIVLTLSHEVYAKKIIIKMATLAPEGTEWHGLLVEMGQELSLYL